MFLSGTRWEWAPQQQLFIIIFLRLSTIPRLFYIRLVWFLGHQYKWDGNNKNCCCNSSHTFFGYLGCLCNAMKFNINRMLIIRSNYYQFNIFWTTTKKSIETVFFFFDKKRRKRTISTNFNRTKSKITACWWGESFVYCVNNSMILWIVDS